MRKENILEGGMLNGHSGFLREGIEMGGYFEGGLEL